MAKIIKGNDRNVFEMGEIVVKTPRVNLLKAIGFAASSVNEYGLSSLKRQLNLSPDLPNSLPGFVLRGIRANRRESRLAQDYPDVIIKTESLFGGWVNIQPRAEPLATPPEDAFSVIGSEIGDDVFQISHELLDTGNLGRISNESVLFVDGGSPRLERYLEIGGAALSSALMKLSEQDRSRRMQ